MSYHVAILVRGKGLIHRWTKCRAFKKICKTPMEAQEKFLRKLLKTHQNTGFGREFDFSSIGSIEDFQKRVPIHTWEDLLPYMKQVYAGSTQALFSPQEKLLMYAKTSGTTGQAKLVPVTQTSFRFYEKYWDHCWKVLEEMPWRPDGKLLYFPSDPEEETVRGIPCGAISGKVFLSLNRMIRRQFVYPFQICRIKDYSLRYYTMMRLALEQDVAMIHVPNPSTVLKLFEVAREAKEDLIEDIEKGVLRDAAKMPEDFLRHLKIRPNPNRARELRNILQRTGDLMPEQYWPGPVGMFCFAAGPLHLYLKELEKYHSRLFITDVGLIASEGRLSFPYGLFKNQRGCPLALESNFFEFIPEDQIESKNPQVLTLGQLEKGGHYFILITNYAGLYRYNINDVIEVVDFLEGTPLITFRHKGKHFSNITGEKISEIQVVESVRKAREKIPMPFKEFVVCLHWDPQLPHYTLLVGNGRGNHHSELQAAVNGIEEELIKENIEYHAKRKSLRLGPLTLKTIDHVEFQAFEEKRQKQVSQLAQYKQVFLVGDPTFENQFKIQSTIPAMVKI